MTTNAKLFLSALGFIALVANPAVAKTHHAKVSRGQTEQVGPPSSVRKSPTRTISRNSHCPSTSIGIMGTSKTGRS